MSPKRSRTPKSDSLSHTGRRRHAAPKDPKWARRAGLVGGVVSAMALSGAAAPAVADNTHHLRTLNTTHTTNTGKSSRTSTARAPQARPATSVTARHAALAVRWEVEAAVFAAEREQAQAQAAKAAAAAEEAAHREAVAAAEAAHAAKERAAKQRAAKAAAAKSAAQAAARAAAAKAAAARAAPAAAPTPRPAATTTAVSTPAPAPTSKVDQLIAFLKAQLGKPYVYGATGPDSYDCSGLTQAAFATIGIDLPRTSQEQSTVGTPVSLSDLQVGDLVFWGGEGSAYHVAVYIGDGQFLAAQNPSKGVVVEPMDFSMPDWAVRVLSTSRP